MVYKHGLSIGVTRSSECFSELNLIQTAATFLLNKNDLTEKIHQTYYFGDDCMSGDEINKKGKLLFGCKHQNLMLVFGFASGFYR